MTKIVDLNEIRQQLYERLKASGWADVLKSFILGDEFLNILQQLLDETKQGKHFTPGLKQVFRAFEECPYKDLKVIVCGQDPYPKKDAADGISFSCSNLGNPEASLRYIFKEIGQDIYGDDEYKADPDLKRWANQGILMLNTALTTQVGKIGMHHEIWRPFTSFLYDTLQRKNPETIHVFLGNKAKEWSAYADPDKSLFVMHPATAAYRGGKWYSDKLFIKLTNKVKEQFNYSIIW